MQTHQSVTKDIHRPRVPAAPNDLSKVRGCLWYSLVNWEDKTLRFWPGPPVILGKKEEEEMTEGKKASRASKSRLPFPPPTPPPPPFSSRSGSATEDYNK